MSARRQRVLVVAVVAAALSGVVPFTGAVAEAAPSPLPTPARPNAPTAASGDLVVDGHGWGHRRGLGQYGSLGYAIDHGWSSAQILDHFYGGTTAGTVDPGQEITVRVISHDDQPLVAQVDQGAIATFTPGGSPTIGSGRAVKIESVGGGFQVSDAPTCGGPWTARPGTVAASDLRVRAADPGGSSTFSYGAVGDVALAGDWDGDGIDTPGVWRAGRFYLSNSPTGGAATVQFTFGQSTDTPIVGDWDGDGIDTIGVRRSNISYLRNSLSGGGADHTFGFGAASDRVVVGDWNGDGRDSIGVRRSNVWMLRNPLSGGAAELVFSFGTASDAPVVGDWDGDGRSGVGVRRGTMWYLRDPLSAGAASYAFDALGSGSPIAGRWVAGARDLVGRVAGNIWEVSQVPAGAGGVLLDGNDQPLARTLQLCHAASNGAWTSAATSSRFYRGELRAIRLDGGATRVVNALGLDWYVRGVVPRESPASWGAIDCWDGTPDCGRNALQAQSVAARSYALGENRAPYAKTCDTTTCQVYLGRASRTAGSSTVTALESSYTNDAVAATSGGVRRTPTGAVARTEFSSSTGGWTAGGVFPSVIDEGDDTASNPNHNWTRTITAAELSARYGKGSLVAATVTSRSTIDGRAVTGLRLDFTGGSITATGDAFRIAWGLKSSWFDLTAVGATPLPIDDVGIHRSNEWHLRNGLPGGTLSFSYGVTTDIPVVGDWNGDGLDTPGLRRGTMWYLRNTSSAGAADVTFEHGLGGSVPVAGDWDDDGTDTVGLRQSNVWYLRNVNSSSGATDVPPFSFGASSDVPVAGDWDGDGSDTIAVFRAGTFFLRNANSSGAADRTVATGHDGHPVVGDWDGDGTDDLGVFLGGTFRLFHGVTGASMGTFTFGTVGDRPLGGRWR